MIPKVLVVTSGIFHPTYFARLAFHKILEDMDGFTYQYIPTLEKLPADLSAFGAIVLYFHKKTVSDAALDRLDDFVCNGGGILAIHSATASFKENHHYFEILGGRFAGHGPVQKMNFQLQNDTIFHGIASFTIKDELYVHEFQPGVEIHFTAAHEGKEVPAVWTYHFGAGKVCYAVPGHKMKSMKNPQVQEIFRRGLRWVCGEKIG
jgi:type 1 glutamine amidotransferase